MIYFRSLKDFGENIRSVVATGGKTKIDDELFVDVMYCACAMRNAGCTKEFIASFFSYQKNSFDVFMEKSWWKVKQECDKNSGMWCGSPVAWDDMIFIAVAWFGREYYVNNIFSKELARVKAENDKLFASGSVVIVKR